jgi:hypothetical protein
MSIFIIRGYTQQWSESYKDSNHNQNNSDSLFACTVAGQCQCFPPSTDRRKSRCVLVLLKKGRLGGQPQQIQDTHQQLSLSLILVCAMCEKASAGGVDRPPKMERSKANCALATVSHKKGARAKEIPLQESAAVPHVAEVPMRRQGWRPSRTAEWWWCSAHCRRKGLRPRLRERAGGYIGAARRDRAA